MPQAAGFIIGAVGFSAPAIGSAAFGGWVAGAAFGSTVLGSLTVKLLGTVAMSALARAVSGQKQGSTGGIKTSSTLTGETNPESIILGRYASAGQAICPPMSHGKNHRYLTHVIELCSAPGATLERLIINDDYVELGGAEEEYGLPVLGDDYRGLIWVKYYDGSQTAADPMLLAKYADADDRPWQIDMIGRGICYAILTFRFDKDRLTSVPNYTFEMMGIPLYDPRKDSSVGGNGAQRWADPSTWVQTVNNAVVSYNIMRGITLPGGDVWGGQVESEDVPLSVWIAGMNACDLAITLSEGGTEPAYRCGYEAGLDTAPADTLEELLKGCCGDVADIAGTWKLRIGGPSLPVFSFADADVIRSKDEDLDPFPSLDSTYNGITASYPEPTSLWQAKDAPGRYNTDWEAADRFGRKTIDLKLSACPYPNQVQRVMRGYIEAERRFRVHKPVLPPIATAIEPLDVIAWTSARNGYTTKQFDVTETVDDLMTCCQGETLKEVDSSDYDWSPSYELPSTPGAPGLTAPAAEVLDNFDVVGIAIQDADGVARRPALRLTWDADTTATGIQYEVRIHGQSDVILSGSAEGADSGRHVVSAGILSEMAYDVHARPIMRGRVTTWTAWKMTTTPNVRLTMDDLADEIKEAFTDIAASHGIDAVSALPASGARDGQIVLNMADHTLYRWDAAAGIWTDDLYAGLPDGYIDVAKFAQGIEPVSVSTASTLPTTKTTSAIVWGGNIYRWSGTAYVKTVAAADIAGTLAAAQIESLAASQITGQLTNAQIAAVAAAKLTGSITGTQIADGAIATAKLAAGSVTTAILATGAVTADDIASNAITSAKILAGSVSTAALAAGSVTASILAANSVTANALAANSVTASAIAANTITAAQIAVGAIGADQIAAGAIMASKLVVSGSLGNICPDMPWRTGDTSAVSSRWFFSSGISMVAKASTQWDETTLMPDNYAMYFPQGTASQATSSYAMQQIMAGETYTFKLRYATGGPNRNRRPRAGIRWFDRSNAYISAALAYGAYTSATSYSDSLYVEAAAPSNAVFAEVWIDGGSASDAGDLYVSLPLILKKSDAAQLIVDGTVTANTIAAGSITSNHLTANSVLASAIAAGAVTASKINVSSLSAISANLGDITVDTAHIANLAVNTIKIANNAITTMATINQSNVSFSASYSNAWTDVYAVSISGESGDRGIAMVNFTFSTTHNVRYRVVLNGSVLPYGSGGGVGSDVVSFTYGVSLSAGANTLKIQAQGDSNDNNATATFGAISLAMLRAMK